MQTDREPRQWKPDNQEKYCGHCAHKWGYRHKTGCPWFDRIQPPTPRPETLQLVAAEIDAVIGELAWGREVSADRHAREARRLLLEGGES